MLDSDVLLGLLLQSASLVALRDVILLVASMWLSRCGRYRRLDFLRAGPRARYKIAKYL